MTGTEEPTTMELVKSFATYYGIIIGGAIIAALRIRTSAIKREKERHKRD